MLTTFSFVISINTSQAGSLQKKKKVLSHRVSLDRTLLHACFFFKDCSKVSQWLIYYTVISIVIQELFRFSR